MRAWSVSLRACTERKKAHGVSTGAGPWHRKRSIVRNPEGFCDMQPTHCTRTLDKKVRSLASFPRCPEQIVQPSAELLRQL